MDTNGREWTTNQLKRVTIPQSHDHCKRKNADGNDEEGRAREILPELQRRGKCEISIELGQSVCTEQFSFTRAPPLPSLDGLKVLLSLLEEKRDRCGREAIPVLHEDGDGGF